MITSHALLRYREFYPMAEVSDVFVALGEAVHAPRAMLTALVGRGGIRDGDDDTADYFVHKDRTGAFVCIGERVVTFLRFYGAQQRAKARAIWGGGVEGDPLVRAESAPRDPAVCPVGPTIELRMTARVLKMAGDVSARAARKAIRASAGAGIWARKDGAWRVFADLNGPQEWWVTDLHQPGEWWISEGRPPAVTNQERRAIAYLTGRGWRVFPGEWEAS